MSTMTPVHSTQTLVSDREVSPPIVVTRRQVWNDIVAPFLATRVVLLFIGWLTRFYPISPDYPLPDVGVRGWQFSPYRLLDLWGRWDTGWYMSIVHDGYMLQADYMHQQSNLAYFPLYSLVVRFLLWPIPDAWQTDGIVLLVGVIVSNLCFLGGMFLLYLFAQEVTHDLGVAQRAVLYLLLFPTAFFLSCFYTESIFLFLSVASLYAAQRRAWAWAALAAALLGITRPLGILIIPVLAWIYLASIGWRINKLRADFLWLLLIPLPFLLFLGWIGVATGDFLAPIHAQQAWAKTFAWPWTTLFAPISPHPIITPLEQFFVLLFLVVALIACWRLSTTAYGLWVLVLILPFLFTGTLTSAMRYILVAAPAFIVLAQLGKEALFDRFFQAFFFAIQVLLMIGWSLFYFIG